MCCSDLLGLVGAVSATLKRAAHSLRAGCLGAIAARRGLVLQRAASPVRTAWADLRSLARCRAAALPRLQASTGNEEADCEAASASQQRRFRLLRIAGDGRCLFRSLAQGAHLAAQALAADGQAPQVLAPPEETSRADELRQAVCDELMQRRCCATISCASSLPWLPMICPAQQTS